MRLIPTQPWPPPINTQTAYLTGGAFSYQQDQNYIADPNGLKAKQMLYKAYECIHKYENFHGNTNRRSELNDRIDKVKEWMIEQWPDISSGYGPSGVSSAMGQLGGSMVGAGAASAALSGALLGAIGGFNTYYQTQKEQKIDVQEPKEPWYKPVKKFGQKLAWDLGLYKSDG